MGLLPPMQRPETCAVPIVPRRMLCFPLACASCVLFRVYGVKDLIGAGQSVPGGGEAGVDGDLEEGLDDFLSAGAIIEGHTDIELERVYAAQAGEYGDAAEAAGAQIEAGAVPDFAADGAHDQAFEVGRKCLKFFA